MAEEQQQHFEPTSGPLALQVFQQLGDLQGKVGRLLEANAESIIHRRELRESVLTMTSTVAVLHQEIQRLSPIVNQLEARFYEGQGLKGGGRLVANFLSGAVGGSALSALVSWLSHR